MPRGKSKLILNFAQLNINEKPYETTIFDDDEEASISLPPTLSRSLKCSDYRTLPWLTPYDLQSSTPPNESRSGGSAHHHKTKGVHSSRSAGHAATANSVSKLQTADFYCVNLESRFILNTGHMAWKHADNIKVKLGSPCVYFNHPEFFTKAGNIFAKEYNLKCRQEEKRREEWERARKIIQSARAAYTSGRPSFCVPAEKYTEDSQCNLTAERPKNSPPRKSPRLSGNGKPLFDPRPWRRDVLELEADESGSRPSESRSPINEAYADAHELIDNHLRMLDRQKLIEVLPVVYPHQSGEE
ncbi:unnamed protein product [Hydatigera taeniaeformis]|uniref:Uncharacterized protein n=1 Tax=Hydatigena taeniaeformis TaxID=6205 RepID=A0A0R3X8H5_HYDTA|nr:unnamed protein product [Hydatigera taeniaeformis]